MITNEMIEERRIENARAYRRKWREENREKYNTYQREWTRRFKAEHGINYATYLGRKRAERELLQEQKGC